MHALERGGALLVADLDVALVEDLEQDVVARRVLAKGLVQLLGRRRLALGDVEEDVGDLEDVVDVRLDALTPLEDLVLVLLCEKKSTGLV